MKFTVNPQCVFAALATWMLPFGLWAANPTPQAEFEVLPDGAIGRLGTHRFVHGQASRVRWLGFADEDRRIFSQSDDNTFGLWEVASGQQVWRSSKELTGALMRAQISADGSVVVVAANGEKIGIMKTADPTAIRWMTGAANRSFDLAISSNGSLAASCDGSQILIWNTGSGEIARRLDADEATRAVALSTDGRLVAGGGKSRTRLWQLTDGKQVAEWVGSPYTLGFTPDASFLAVSMSTRLSPTTTRDSLRLLALPDGQVKWEVGGGFNQVVFSPDGAQLAAAGLEGVAIFEAASGKLRHRIAYGGNQHVWAIAFSHDGKLLASGGDDARIRFWRTSDWSEVNKGHGHEGPVDCLAFSPDGRTLATGGRDKSVRLWAWRDGRDIHTIPNVGRSWGIEKVGFSPDGTKLASLAQVQPGDRLSLWNVASGEKIISMGPNCGQGLAFAPDSRELFTGMHDGSIAVWNPDTGVLVRQIGKWKGAVFELAMLPGGKQVAWMGEYQGLGIRDLATGADLKFFMGGNHHANCHFALAQDGSLVAAGSLVWDAATGELLSENSGSGTGEPAAISPDGRLVAWVGNDQIQIWERLTRQRIHTFDTGAGRANDLAFSPDGTTLGSAGHDGSVLLWDVTGGSRPGAVAAAVADFAGLWEQLGGEDHWAAHRAAWKLAHAGPAAVAWLGDKLPPAKAPDDGEINQLRGQFQSPDFEVRERAARTLLDLGLTLSLAETNALRRPVPDLRSNIIQADEIMPGRGRTMPGPPPKLYPLPDRRRGSRAIMAIEHSLAPNAVQLLERLAGGWPQHPQTQEAKAALRRAARQK